MRAVLVSMFCVLVACSLVQRANSQLPIRDTAISILADRVERFRDDARQYRDRAAPLERRAKLYASRAANLSAKLSQTRDESDRQALQDSISRYSDLARDLNESARKLVEKADQAEQEAQRADVERQKIIALRQQEIDEHERALAEIKAEREAKANAYSYKIELEQAVGIWRPESDGNWPFVIVQEQPESELYPNRLEVHTEKRVWKGDYEPSTRGDAVRAHEARMRFSYRPSAAEMNSDIPLWARSKLENNLEWVLEINEAGDSANPRLAVQWFPGEITWDDDRNVSIIGRGIPIEFKMLKETHLSIFETGQAFLWMEPARDTSPKAKLRGAPPEPSSKRIQALLKGQPFTIKVRVPQAQAASLGDRIYARVEGERGGQVRLPLLRRTPNGMGPVLFSLDEPVTINNRDSEGDLKPQVGSFQWLAEAFGLPEGRRLQIEMKNKDRLTATFSGAEHSVLVYDHVLQRGLDEHLDIVAKILESKDQITENPALFRSLTIDESKTGGVRDSAADEVSSDGRLALNEQALENYLELMRQDDLLEIHKFHLGEMYLRGVSTSVPVYDSGSAAFSAKFPLYMLDQEAIDDVFAARRITPPKSAYFTELVRGFVGALRGGETDPVAIRMADRVQWTCESEKGLVAIALENASDSYAADFETVVGKIAYSVPKALAQEASIWLFQQNLNGKFVSSSRRDLVKSRTILSTILGVSTNAAPAYLARLGNMPSIGPLSRLKARALNPLSRPMLSVNGLSRISPELTTMKRPYPVYADLVSDNLPKGLTTRQKNSIALELAQFADDVRTPPCYNSRVRGVDDLLDGEDLGALNLDENYFLQEGRKMFGPNTEYISSPELYPPQTSGTCALHSMIDSIQTNTGAKIDPRVLLAEAIEIERNILHPKAKSGDLNFTPFAISGNTRVQVARSKGLVDWFEQIGRNEQTSSFQKHLAHSEQNGFYSITGRYLLRKYGASVASVNPARNSKTHVSHIAAALDDGYEVRIMLDLTSVTGEPSFHAIKIAGYTRSSSDPRFITHIDVYESNFGGRIFRIPASDFQNLIARQRPDGTALPYGNMEVVNWGNRATSKRTWQSTRQRDNDVVDVDYNSPTERPPRMRSVDDMMEALYPNGNMPEIHVTSLEGFRAIRRSGQLELADSGASFSSGGNVGAARGGEIAIRIREDFQNNVEFVDHFAGKIAFWWPDGIGTGRRYSGFIPTRALQYLNPETGKWSTFATR